MPAFFYVAAPMAAALALAALFLGPRRAWALWRRMGRALGDLIGRVVLTLFYFSILVPFALIARVFQDPLGVKRADGPLWLSVDQEPADLVAAHRQH